MGVLLQKGSPYLDDVNQIVDLANQMGLIQNEIQKKVPYATHCLTWSAVKESHMRKGQNAVFHLADMYGTLIIFGLGLGTAMLTLIAELIVHKSIHQGQTRPGRIHIRA